MKNKNDITLDVIWNKGITPEYQENFDKIDFSVKAEETVRLADNAGQTSRYLEVSPAAFNFVSMDYHHPDHNLKLTFDVATGKLLNAEVI